MLELRDLHKRYGDIVALDGCTFTVARGQLLGFLGPNGAGKTTAMRSIFGLVEPDQGDTRWERQPITHDVRLTFGYMPEQRGLYPRMRIHDQLRYFGRLHAMTSQSASDEADRWLTELGLGERRDDRLEELSHGNQQRVQLAAALVHKPDLLVLDEPFSGLDPLGVSAMASILAEQAAGGAAVVFSSHQLDLVEDLCEDVVVIDRGHIVLSGPVAELRARSPVRYLTVETDGGTDWVGAIPNAEIVGSNGRRVTLSVPADTDLAAAVEAARRSGAISQFSFEPPNLSEVFRDAVGQ